MTSSSSELTSCLNPVFLLRCFSNDVIFPFRCLPRYVGPVEECTNSLFSSISAEVLFLDDEHTGCSTDWQVFRQQSVACEKMMEHHAQVAYGFS